MSSKAKTDAEKREALRARIESSEQRNAQRSFVDQAKSATDGAMEYVKANPLKAVAAVAVGALVIGAMTRPGRRAGRRAGALTRVAGDAALAYGLSLFDSAGSAARRGHNRIGEFGANSGDKARGWRRSAADGSSELTDTILDAARRGGRRAGRSIEQLRSRLTH
ncbi:hypothetical protein [Qipengyuania sediminis]|uniref:hypothetical protein n=1 Tax=Qipengyuania sediminis TaxID=1532023 RepID=UPI00105A66F7|nr:hypothetical protein [Qipengyuania sediminis]